MDVFDLAAKLTLDSSEYDKGLTGAEEKAGGFGSKVKKGLAVGGAAVMAVGTAAVAAGTAVVKATGDVAEYGDNIDKMAQKMGISIEKYQEWDAVLKHSGSSMETMKASMKTLATAVEKGNDAFEKIGLTQEDLAKMSQEEIFEATIAGLQNVEDTTERTYLAGQLLGRGATELGALLNTSAEDTQAMRDRVRELGGVMSEDAVKAAAKYQDTLQDLQTGFEGLKRNLISNFLPGITTVMEGLTALSTGDYDLGVEKIGEGIDNFIDKTTEKLPAFIDVGFRIIEKISESVTNNLPKLVEMGAKVIVMLINGVSSALPTLVPVVVTAIGDVAMAIINNLPTILSAILSLITTLADAILTQGLPKIIEMLPSFIVGIVKFILQASTQITNAVLDIVIAIAELAPDIIVTLVKELPGIISAIIEALLENGPELSDAIMKLTLMSLVIIPMVIVEICKRIPEIFTAVVNAFKENWPKLKEAGYKAFEEATKGMFSTGIFNKMGEGVGKLMAAGLTKLKSFISQFKQMGEDIMRGLISGIQDKISEVTNVISGVASTVSSSFKKVLGISSPSKVFMQYGKYTDEGYAKGVMNNMNIVDNAMDSLYDSVLDVPKISGNVNAGLYGNDAKGYNNLVEAFLEALIAAAPYYEKNFKVTANKDSIVDIMLEANRQAKISQGKGVMA